MTCDTLAMPYTRWIFSIQLKGPLIYLSSQPRHYYRFIHFLWNCLGISPTTLIINRNDTYLMQSYTQCLMAECFRKTLTTAWWSLNLLLIQNCCTISHIHAHGSSSLGPLANPPRTKWPPFRRRYIFATEHFCIVSKFHLSVFLRVLLTITDHWFREWLVAESKLTRFTDAYMWH